MKKAIVLPCRCTIHTDADGRDRAEGCSEAAYWLDEVWHHREQYQRSRSLIAYNSMLDAQSRMKGGCQRCPSFSVSSSP